MGALKDRFIDDRIRDLLAGPPRTASDRELELGTHRLRQEVASPRRGAFAAAAVAGGSLAAVLAAISADLMLDILLPGREGSWLSPSGALAAVAAVLAAVLAVVSLRYGLATVRARREVLQGYQAWWSVWVRQAPDDPARRRFLPRGPSERAALSSILIALLIWAMSGQVAVLWLLDPQQVRLVYGVSAVGTFLVWSVAVWNITVARMQERKTAAREIDKRW